MSDNPHQQPTEQELFTLRHLAAQASDPNVSADQILHHLHQNQEALRSLQQQFHEAQQQFHAHSTNSNNPNPDSPILTLSSALQSFAAQNAEFQRSQQVHQENINRVLEALTHRNSSTRLPAPLSPKFKGLDTHMSFAEFKSKLNTAYQAHPDAFTTGANKINYALQSMEGDPALYFAPLVNGETPDNDGILTSFKAFTSVLEELYGNKHLREESQRQLD
ncbi:hypothetical protein BG006_004754, partial [Podila minutissima]